LTEPKFASKAKLARYISEEFRLRGNRPADAAFLPDPRSTNPENDHFSVNSLEVEKVKEIAAYHRHNWQSNAGEVALCMHNVHDYSDVGRKCSVSINFDRKTGTWSFISSAGRSELAYRHRPVTTNVKNPLGSPSHCGVEFVRALSEYAETQFARRMSGKGRFQRIK